MIVFFVVLFMVLYSDARLLRRVDPQRFERIMQFNPLRWAVYAVFLPAAMLPIYLLRRRRFFRDGEMTHSSADLVLSGFFDVVLKWLCGVMLVVLAVKLGALVNPSIHRSLLSVLLVSGFSSLWIVWLIIEESKRPGQRSLQSSTAFVKTQRPAFKSYFFAVSLGLVFACISTYILLSRSTTPSTPLNEALQVNQSLLAMFLFVFLGVLAAPLLEEIIFRGYLFGVVQSLKGMPLAVAVTSLIFALLHVGQYWGDWPAIAVVFFLGLEITLLRAWTGSIFPGIVTHYVYNIMVSVLPVIILTLSNPSFVEYMSKYETLTVEKKEELLLDSIQRRPDFAEAYNDLAWLYAENKENLHEALRLINAALIREPDNPAFLDTKAEVLFVMGRIEEAVEIERKLAKKFPSMPYYFEQLNKFEGHEGGPANREPVRRRLHGKLSN